MSLFKPKYCFGIYISAHQIIGVVAEQDKGSINPVKSYVADDELDMFSEQGSERLTKNLAMVLDEFIKDFKRKYIPLQIALADPLVKTAVFEVDAVPAQTNAKDQLVRWRFDKDCHVDMNQMAVALQAMSASAGKPQIYSLATSTNIVEIITSLCKQKRLMLSVIDSAVNNLFNYHYESMDDTAGLLLLNDDYWTLITWDSDKRIRYVRSKWLRSNGHESDKALNATLLDVERLLHSFNKVTGDRPTRLYVEPLSHDRSSLQAALDERLKDNFTFLDKSKFTPPAGVSSNYCLAAMAARSR